MKNKSNMKNIPVKFSPIIEEDKNYIWGLFQLAMKPYIEKLWSWNQSYQEIEFERNLTCLHTLIIKVGSENVGYVQYALNHTNTFLHMFILQSNYRRMGYGAQIVGYLKNLQPDKPLVLECLNINPKARSFYDNNGFVKIKNSDIFSVLKL